MMSSQDPSPSLDMLPALLKRNAIDPMRISFEVYYSLLEKNHDANLGKFIGICLFEKFKTEVQPYVQNSHRLDDQELHALYRKDEWDDRLFSEIEDLTNIRNRQTLETELLYSIHTYHDANLHNNIEQRAEALVKITQYLSPFYAHALADNPASKNKLIQFKKNLNPFNWFNRKQASPNL